MGSDDVESTFVPDPSAQPGDDSVLTLAQLVHTHTLQTTRKKKLFSETLRFGGTGLVSKGASFTGTRIPRTSGCSQRSIQGMMHAHRACIRSRVFVVVRRCRC